MLHLTFDWYAHASHRREEVIGRSVSGPQTCFRIAPFLYLFGFAYKSTTFVFRHQLCETNCINDHKMSINDPMAWSREITIQQTREEEKRHLHAPIADRQDAATAWSLSFHIPLCSLPCKSQVDWRHKYPHPHHRSFQIAFLRNKRGRGPLMQESLRQSQQRHSPPHQHVLPYFIAMQSPES